MLEPLRRWMKAEDARAEDDPRAPWRLFWVALLVRVAYMTLAHTWRVRPYQDHFHFGWEAGRIAYSLVTGHGYGSPFATRWLPDTGPTAWVPPAYPLLLAAVFKVFGVYSNLSAWILLAINSVFSAATARAAWEIGCRLFSRRNAVWAGWLWALYPAAMQYSVRWFWEMSLTAFLFAWVIVLALRMRGIHAGARPQPERSASSQTRPWLLFGLLWGVLALSTTTLLLLLPVCGLWILIGTWHRAHALRNAVLAGLVFLACLAPWEARNYRVFHTFIPIRGNFGAENYLGNGPGSRGVAMAYDHPTFASDQLRLYAAMGEVRYAKMRGDMARAYIRAHPSRFFVNTLRRIYFFWMSVPSDAPWPLELARVLNYGIISIAGLLGLALALARREPASGLFAWIYLLLPLTYYFVFVEARYRHPLEPLLAVFGVYLFQSAAARQPIFLKS